MPSLVWSDAFTLDLALMDETHQEFVVLLAEVESASDETVVECWKQLVAHTQEHFDREDQWMVLTRFARGNCHSSQHEMVLNVLKEGTKRGLMGELEVIRQMARELVDWFPAHAQAMDAALAAHLRRVAFDPATGIVHAPEALPEEEIHGCGGSTCSDVTSAAAEAAA